MFLHSFSVCKSCSGIICGTMVLAVIIMVCPAWGGVDVVIEPWTYREDFESCSLRAWASYPIWQDTAFDQNFRVDTIVSGDKNISLVQKVTPYSNNTVFAGAQKRLDMYLTPDSKISFRYYLKTNKAASRLVVRLAAGEYGRVEYPIETPPVNRWERVTVSFGDLTSKNPSLAGKNELKINDLAIMTEIPGADPDMPIYFGLDDIQVKGAKEASFTFVEPIVYKLQEYSPFIARNHYLRGDVFRIKGDWPFEAKRVVVRITSFTDRELTIIEKPLHHRGGAWLLEGMNLTVPPGMYLAAVRAYDNKRIIAESSVSFIVLVNGKEIGHPRLLFDENRQSEVIKRLEEEKFKDVNHSIIENARLWREKLRIEDITYYFDQFYNERDFILTSAGQWETENRNWAHAAESNALAWALKKDREAGEYTIRLLERVCSFPTWLHPWLIKRGWYGWHALGDFNQRYAIAYDLTWNIMTESERERIRAGFMKNIVLPTHRTYVEEDMVVTDTSNWLAHIIGGTLMCMTAMYGETRDSLEPWLSGALFKYHDFITSVHGDDGSYGEGYGYNSYTMQSFARCLPVLEHMWGIDFSAPLQGTYQETIWTSVFEEKKHFHFGDSSDLLRPMTDWAWLLAKYKDPLLSWWYNEMKTDETFMDVLYNTENIQRESPYNKNPVRVFRSTGTTVFRSGWTPEDFIFVLRTGPFYNHQHLDQGTFWLWDRGTVFIGERHGSAYFADPLYQPSYIQPVAHSTILIDDNHQSQRTGDHRRFAPGFSDFAFIEQFLDGAHAAFVSGDIGRLYHGVTSLKRNVLYIKPRTVIMADTLIPEHSGTTMTLLYQGKYLDEITAGDTCSTIACGGNTLTISHLYPKQAEVERVETPHYLYTLNGAKPLKKEGMLSVRAVSDSRPLVMANLLTTLGDSGNDRHSVDDDSVKGKTGGIEWTLSINLGAVRSVGGMTTDALVTAQKNRVFLAGTCKVFSIEEGVSLEADNPLTFECSADKPDSLKYCTGVKTTIAMNLPVTPKSVVLNGKPCGEGWFDKDQRKIRLILPKGNGTIVFKYR